MNARTYIVYLMGVCVYILFNHSFIRHSTYTHTDTYIYTQLYIGHIIFIIRQVLCVRGGNLHFLLSVVSFPFDRYKSRFSPPFSSASIFSWYWTVFTWVFPIDFNNSPFYVIPYVYSTQHIRLFSKVYIHLLHSSSSSSLFFLLVYSNFQISF